jgi:hypothetical protein
MPTVQAKGKIRRRHQIAITEFQAWKKGHPKATRRECVEAFDRCVDFAQFAEIHEGCQEKDRQCP